MSMQNQWLGTAPTSGGCVGIALLPNFDGSTHLLIASPQTGFINHLEFPVNGAWAWRNTAMMIPGTLVGVTAYYDVDAGEMHVIAANSNFVYESVFAPGDVLPAANGIANVLPDTIAGLVGTITGSGTGHVYVLTTAGSVYTLVGKNGNWAKTKTTLQIPGTPAGIAALTLPSDDSVHVFIADLNFIYEAVFTLFVPDPRATGIAQIPSSVITGLSAYADYNNFMNNYKRHILVASQDGLVRKLLGQDGGWNWQQNPIMVVGNIAGVGASLVNYATNVFAGDKNGDVFASAAKSFAADIFPLFRPDIDIPGMKTASDPIDLSSYDNVRARAYEIYWVLSHPTPALTMPCDGQLWPQWKLDLFKAWLDDGLHP
jgi:hypothetical protein